MKTENFDVTIPTLDGTGTAEVVTIQVPVIWDEDIQEWLLTPEAHELIEETKARYMGLLTPEQIRELRKHLDLTQKEISALLQLGEKTWTRWESGRERPSRSMNILLQALWDGRLDVNYLRQLHQPKLRFQPIGRPVAYRVDFSAFNFSLPAPVDFADEALAA